eukprot:TRINITY_DN5667_c0_g1_i1.p1 TRINITY_DN5667_c0_g1~~TRINITY_DN5667_c0_g1_i1.p1  ORF type:complete len:758 (-),score=140.63 TRINITY_DN5667_c0_g1_i1:415-2487(-)
MESQYNYYKKSFEIFETIKPRMDQLKAHVDHVRQQELHPVKEGYLYTLSKQNHTKFKVNPIKAGKGNWVKKWFVLRDGLMYHKDGKIVDESGILDIVLVTVRKRQNPKRFDVHTPGRKKPTRFLAETEEDCEMWVKLINNAVALTLNSRSLDGEDCVVPVGTPRFLAPTRRRKPAVENEIKDDYMKYLTSTVGNTTCVDCGTADPNWVSINLGVLMCLECSGVHRGLGTHVSKVRSLTLDKLEPELLIVMRNLGNKRINEILEKNMPEENYKKPFIWKEDAKLRNEFIKAKYVAKDFMDKETHSGEDLFREVAKVPADVAELQTGMKKLICALVSGVDVNWKNAEGATSLHAAVLTNNAVYMEMLLQNGASLFACDKRGWTALHYAAYLNYTKAMTVLLKKGSAAKRFTSLYDYEGKNPLDIAQAANSDEIIGLLTDVPNKLVATGFQYADVELAFIPMEKGPIPVLPPIKERKSLPPIPKNIPNNSETVQTEQIGIKGVTVAPIASNLATMTIAQGSATLKPTKQKFETENRKRANSFGDEDDKAITKQNKLPPVRPAQLKKRRRSNTSSGAKMGALLKNADLPKKKTPGVGSFISSSDSPIKPNKKPKIKKRKSGTEVITHNPLLALKARRQSGSDDPEPKKRKPKDTPKKETPMPKREPPKREAPKVPKIPKGYATPKKDKKPKRGT